MADTKDSRAKALRAEERAEDDAEDAADRRAEDRDAVRVAAAPAPKPKPQQYPKWIKAPFVNVLGEKSTVDVVVNSEDEAEDVKSGDAVVKCIKAQSGDVYHIE